MPIGPFTFRLPHTKIAALIVAQRTSQREYRIMLIGAWIGFAALWFIALVSDFQSDWMLAAVIFTALNASLPLHLRYWARRSAKTMNGVATAQTWMFDSTGITVINENGQTITSPWSVVARVSRDQDYGYLEDGIGGKSPLPLTLIGASGMDQIELLHKEATVRPSSASRP